MSTRRYVLSLLFVLLLTAAGVLGLTIFDKRPTLGLDLRGGLSVILGAKGKTSPAVLDKTRDIIEERVNALGTSEPDVSRSGDRHIIVQLPGIKDRERALQVIGKTAQLRFREVLESLPEPEAKQKGWKLTEGDPADKDVFFAEEASGASGIRWYHLGPALILGDQIGDAYAQFSDGGTAGWIVQLVFKREGAQKFADVTRRLAPGGEAGGKQLAIVLDQMVESAPQVQQEISDGRAQISGTFTERESRDLALVLKTGSLPIDLQQEEVRTVSPTLGAASLRAGLLAGLIGLAAVALFMLIFYRALGVLTIVGLGIFGALVLGLIGAIQFTLTLAGIAGIIVSIGIAADSYIVYYARIRDEMREGKSFRSAVDRAFRSAFKTTVSANTVAFMAAIILYWLAVGPVRGFALTLGISSLLDIFLLYFFTHPAVALLARSKRIGGARKVVKTA